MDLVPYSDDDIRLIEELECDPETMRELGGPVSSDDLSDIHTPRLATAAGGDWFFKIVPEPNGPPAGTIGIWAARWRGASIHETGWMVLPAFQGRGVASAALETILGRARAEERFPLLHALSTPPNMPVVSPTSPG